MSGTLKPGQPPNPGADVDMNVTAADRRHPPVPTVDVTRILSPPGQTVEVTAAGPQPSTDPSAGIKQLGRYVVLTKIGQGGMGVVLAGYDPNLDRRVALKLLRREVATREWLLREGQAVGRLSHPNVVNIYEVAEHENQAFLAMEYVEGPTLRTWLQDERRPFQEVLRKFVQAGRGLAAVHSAGLVHRDFKPDNVLVGRDGRVRVVDFGIAALADAVEAPSGHTPTPMSPLASPLTQSGALMGTPAYMSPEQLRGERATAQSDQWSFCVALYRATYGVSPFPTDDVDRLARAVHADPPTPPPFMPEAPLWLAPIILRGLQKSPDARYPSMRALLDAIERHLPLDEQHDPMIVVRERQILSGLFVMFTTAWALLYLRRDTEQWLTSPRGLIIGPLLPLMILLTAVGVRWRYLRQNVYGRTIAALFPSASLMLLLNHVVAIKLAIEPTIITVEDLILLSTFYLVAACTLENWLILLSAIAGAAALAGAFTPDEAATAFGLCGLLSVLMMAGRLFLDRYMKPSDSSAMPGA